MNHSTKIEIEESDVDNFTILLQNYCSLDNLDKTMFSSDNFVNKVKDNNFEYLSLFFKNNPKNILLEKRILYTIIYEILIREKIYDYQQHFIIIILINLYDKYNKNNNKITIIFLFTELLKFLYIIKNDDENRKHLQDRLNNIISLEKENKTIFYKDFINLYRFYNPKIHEHNNKTTNSNPTISTIPISTNTISNPITNPISPITNPISPIFNPNTIPNHISTNTIPNTIPNHINPNNPNNNELKIKNFIRYINELEESKTKIVNNIIDKIISLYIDYVKDNFKNNKQKLSNIKTDNKVSFIIYNYLKSLFIGNNKSESERFFKFIDDKFNYIFTQLYNKKIKLLKEIFTILNEYYRLNSKPLSSETKIFNIKNFINKLNQTNKVKFNFITKQIIELYYRNKNKNKTLPQTTIISENVFDELQYYLIKEYNKNKNSKNKNSKSFNDFLENISKTFLNNMNQKKKFFNIIQETSTNSSNISNNSLLYKEITEFFSYYNNLEKSNQILLNNIINKIIEVYSIYVKINFKDKINKISNISDDVVVYFKIYNYLRYTYFKNSKDNLFFQKINSMFEFLNNTKIINVTKFRNLNNIFTILNEYYDIN